MSGKHAVVFVSDPAFLLPTLVAARQVRDQIGTDVSADVFIILVGFDGGALDTASAIIATEGMFSRNMSDVELPTSVRFNRNHVPQSSLGPVDKVMASARL